MGIYRSMMNGNPDTGSGLPLCVIVRRKRSQPTFAPGLFFFRKAIAGNLVAFRVFKRPVATQL